MYQIKPTRYIYANLVRLACASYRILMQPLLVVNPRT